MQLQWSGYQKIIVFDTLCIEVINILRYKGRTIIWLLSYQQQVVRVTSRLYNIICCLNAKKCNSPWFTFVSLRRKEGGVVIIYYNIMQLECSLFMGSIGPAAVKPYTTYKVFFPLQYMLNLKFTCRLSYVSRNIYYYL